MTRRGALLAVAAALLSPLASPGAAGAGERPPLLDPQAGCERWLGTASGNDPSVRLQMRLCPDGDGVRGEAQWSSLRSGWNVRAVSGRWNGTQLELRDERLVEERPNPGWRFCTIDRWELARDGDVLTGRYVSAACSDEASVRLERMPDPPPAEQPATAQTPGHPAPSPPPTPSPPQPAVPNLPDVPAGTRDAGCGACTVGRTTPPPFAALALLPVLALRRRR